MRRTKIIKHLSDDELKLHYDECLNPKVKERWHLLWLVQVKGITAKKASELLGHNNTFGCYWIKRYNEKGISAIIFPKPGNPTFYEKKVTEEMKAELLDYLKNDPPTEIGGGLWNGPKVKAFLEFKFGVKVHRKTGHAILRECDYSVTTVRPRHKQTPKEEKEKFKKKTLPEKVQIVKRTFPVRNVRIFAQDECRLGLKPILRKIWTPVGRRPEVIVYPRYEWFYICSAVEPLTGDQHSLIWSTMNLRTMQYWLDSFSEYLRDDVAILVCDQAGWHSETGLNWPENVIRCPLPAYSPECNPAERLWTWVRERLSNKVFESLDIMRDCAISIIEDMDKFKPKLKSMLNYWWWGKAIN